MKVRVADVDVLIVFEHGPDGEIVADLRGNVKRVVFGLGELTESCGFAFDHVLDEIGV